MEGILSYYKKAIKKEAQELNAFSKNIENRKIIETENKQSKEVFKKLKKQQKDIKVFAELFNQQDELEKMLEHAAIQIAIISINIQSIKKAIKNIGE